MPSDRRRDTLAFKQQINEVLGDNATHYWSALKDFMVGRLNRDEFDHWVTLYLPADKFYLHNEFLLATLLNALLEAPPPGSAGKGSRRRFSETDGDKAVLTAGQADSDESTTLGTPLDTSTATGKRPDAKSAGKGANETPAEAKRRALKQAIRSLSRPERDRIKGILKRNVPVSMRLPAATRPSPRVSYPPSLVRLAGETGSDVLSSFSSEYMRNLQAPLCSDTQGIPSGDALLDRMHAVAMEYGVRGIQQGAVRLMFSALEIHLKTIVEQCISKLRVNRTCDTQPAVAVSTSSAAQQPSDTTADAMAVDEEGPSGSAFGTEGEGASEGAERPVVTYHAPANTITPQDLAFATRLAPHVLVEPPLNIERLTSVILADGEPSSELNLRLKRLATAGAATGASMSDSTPTVSTEDGAEQSALDAFLDSVLEIQYAV